MRLKSAGSRDQQLVAAPMKATNIIHECSLHDQHPQEEVQGIAALRLVDQTLPVAPWHVFAVLWNHHQPVSLMLPASKDCSFDTQHLLLSLVNDIKAADDVDQ